VFPVHSGHEIQRIGAPYVTWAVMFATMLVQVWTAGLSARDEWEVAYTFGLVPGAVLGGLTRPPPIDLVPAWLTLLTYPFLHGGFGHFLANMLALYVFGCAVEDRLSHVRYAVLFAAAGAAGALAHAATDPLDTTVLIGASGAVAGVMGAYLLLLPQSRITVLGLMVIPFRLRAWVVIVVWLAVQVYMAGAADDGGIAWWAHLGGFALGLAVGAWYRWRPL
jgi:membrane associated rhomboid family serine protease